MHKMIPSNKIMIYNIDSEFSHIQIDDLDVIMKDYKYVNASMLCDAVNKSFHEWKDMESSKEIIREIERLSVIGNSSKYSAIINVSSENYKNFSGYYVSIELLPYLAYCLSPSIAGKVTLLTRQYMRKLELASATKYMSMMDVIELLNVKYDKDMILTKKTYENRKKKIITEIAEMKEESRKLRMAHCEDLRNNRTSPRLKEKYRVEVSCLRNKLIYAREMLESNFKNLSHEVERLKNDHVADMDLLQTYLSSDEEEPVIMRKVFALVRYRLNGLQETECGFKNGDKGMVLNLQV